MKASASATTSSPGRAHFEAIETISIPDPVARNNALFSGTVDAIIQTEAKTAKLLAAGFDVWVVDDLPQPVLTVSAADYGVDP